MEFLFDKVLPHWPFVFMAFTIGLFGQVAKNAIWTKERAAVSWVHLMMRGTLPVHGVFAGALAGWIGFPVSPGVEYWQGAVLYHCTAGAVSTLAYDFFKSWAKHKTAFKEAREERMSMTSDPPGAA